MNSAMRGITQKKFKKKAKLDMLNNVVRQQDAVIKYLQGKLEQEKKNNATVQVADRESLPTLQDDNEVNGVSVEESRGAVLEGQGSSGEESSVGGTLQVGENQAREEEVIRANPPYDGVPVKMAKLEGMEGD
jgi:hypothetical protein